MAKQKLTEAQFTARLAENLGDFEYVGGERGARIWLKEFKKTVAECLAEGNQVSLTGLLRMEPRLVPEKKKGEMVRNPSTGETRPRAASEPASFKVKAFASSSLRAIFPAVRTAAGKRLAEQLTK